ncbi:MAG: AAA family ATPase, partial [bacterium]
MEGTILNRRYELKSLLGRSDLGALYLANDIANGELLAVKVFSGVVDLRGEDGTRYRNAVRRVEGFHHPHLLTPTAVDSSGGTAYQVAPYFPAQPLDALLESAPLKLTEIVTLLQQIASGLQALHGLGLVHGNLKPSNLLVSREEDRIHGVAADPFLTLLRGAATAHLEPGEAPFRAPEEVPWLDRPADARSDLYALGTLAYRLLAGRLPYPADDPVALIGERFAGPPPSPRDWNHVVPERLAAIVLRLLARQPQERYPSAAALLADLRDWAKPQTVPLGRFDTPHPTAAGDRVPGRESAQEAVRSALARAAMGEGSLLLLAGEAGLGKRSLFESLAFSMEASGALVLRAEVPAAGWSAPFQIPLAVLSALLQRWEYLSSDRRRDLLYFLNSRVGDNGALLTGLLPDLSTLLPKQEPPAPIPADRARPRMLAVLTDAICALAGRERPLVLWIGGLQRADG